MIKAIETDTSVKFCEVMLDTATLFGPTGNIRGWYTFHIMQFFQPSGQEEHPSW